MTGALFHLGARYTHTIQHPKIFIAGKWIYETEKREVILMAVSGKYAMVRRPRCVPYVCSTKDLS